MRAYYNEIDPKAAAWLRELIKEGHIADGEVDQRDIKDVRPSDLKGFTQHHFFAGIGVWSYALRLAGWPDDKPVWTGSCPCQPFSTAGRRKGASDERHLWPAWHWLIREYRPNTIFGEQVASRDGITWLDIVSTDLEGESYAVAPIVLPACGVGAPHMRARTFFVAHASSQGLQGELRKSGFASSSYREAQEEGRQQADLFGGSGNDFVGGLSNAAGPVNGFWRDAEWIYCRDEKFRPIEPGTFPLAHGAPERVGRLRGYGNAIVAQAAAEFIKAAKEFVA